jgi:Putative zinc-finger
MKKLDCSEAEKLIVFDLDGSLDPDNKDFLESHVRACDSCRRMREEFRTLFSTVAADVPPDPGEEFWRRYDSTLTAALREKEAHAGWGLRWKLVGALFAAVLAVTAIFTSLHDFESTQPLKQLSQEKLVIRELAKLYGPSSEEFLQTSKDSAVLTDANFSQSDDTVLDWFEVEDEPNNLFL